MQGEYIFVENRSVTTKDGKRSFNVVKLVHPGNYIGFEGLLDKHCIISADIKPGTVVQVKVQLEQRGYNLSCTILEIKKVA